MSPDDWKTLREVVRVIDAQINSTLGAGNRSLKRAYDIIDEKIGERRC